MNININIRKNIYRQLSVKDRVTLAEVIDDRSLWKSIVKDLSKVYIIYTKSSGMSPQVSKFMKTIEEKDKEIFSPCSVIQEYNLLDDITQESKRNIIVHYMNKTEIACNMHEVFKVKGIGKMIDYIGICTVCTGEVNVEDKIMYDMALYRLEFNGKEIQSGQTYRELGIGYSGNIFVYKR